MTGVFTTEWVTAALRGFSRTRKSSRYFNVMFTHSTCLRPLKAWALFALGCCALALAGPALAGQYRLQAEQSNSVVVAADVQNAEQVCNLEITVAGQPPVEREVRAPYFEARIDITPAEVSAVAVTWRGKSRRVGNTVLNACPTQGGTQFQVVANNVALRAAWARWLQDLGVAKSDCVLTAMRVDRVRYEWFDAGTSEVSPEDWKIQRALSQCDAFLGQKKVWGEQNPKDFACNLAGGLKTRCEGFYTATDAGKTQSITAEAAIRRQLDGQPWSTGLRETAGAKNARTKQAQALAVKQEVDEEARLKAQEQARLREILLAQEAQEAQIRERKEKAIADRARLVQDIERKEQERLEKRSWMLKQLEKLRSDPDAEAKAKAEKADKAEEGKAKEGAGKAVPGKPDTAKPEATPPAAAVPAVPEVPPGQPQAEAPSAVSAKAQPTPSPADAKAQDAKGPLPPMPAAKAN